ncbi:MAG TPA: hypothetical protein VEG38_11535 [Acidimicrobiia bacterium]|nr:hypothetical protein [Acidimicrobiia bacterium]
MRRTLLVAAAVLLSVGASAVPASAHSVSGVSATNLHTTLNEVAPSVPGLAVKVVESGSRLEVVNRTGRELIVLGYKDEPYLRIGPDGVFQNLLSPATYINRTRDGEEPTDAAKNAKVGETDWEKISSEPVARWHDHRIHWMAPTDPPEARAEPDKRHVINAEWVVPLRLEGQAIAVKGDLVWEPGPSAVPWYALIVVLVAGVVLIARQARWAAGLAAVTAVLLAVDVFHMLGLGLANAGSLGSRLGKGVTMDPLAVATWVVAVIAIVWLLRRGPDGLPLVALAGLGVAFLGGLSDINALSRSEVPFGFGAGLARLAVSASIGLGFGLAIAAALRLAGVFGPVRTVRAPAGARGDSVATPGTSPV